MTVKDTRWLTRLLLGCSLLIACEPLQGRAAEHVAAVLDVAPVWSGHPVGFCLLTHGTNQYVAYYDTNRQMTVAWRGLPGTNWLFQPLPSTVGWDSHNYITMALDAAQCLHVSGNMHVGPLVYFRSTRPLDITSLKPESAMTGDREKSTTYPRFLTDPAGRMIYTYRDGHSGGGDQILNVYDTQNRQWHHLLPAPLFAGRGKMNAYFVGPVLGPDQFYHMCWVWRDSPDCSSNHDLSYARSRDLVHWERSNGRALSLPITLATGEVVDPVPARGGIVNGQTQIGFDCKKRLVLSYFKYSRKGPTQIYCARRESNRWRYYQVSDWDYRWEFCGGGSIVSEIGVGPVQVDADGRLTLNYRSSKAGAGTWILDEATLKPIGQASRANPLAGYDTDEMARFPGLRFHQADDLGAAEPGVRYVLRWQTLPANRDRPREGPLPPPSVLRLYKLERDQPAS